MDHFVFELKVCQLVVQLRRVLTFNNHICRGQRDLENEGVVQGARIENTVVLQDFVVQGNAVFVAINGVQYLFRIKASPEFDRILHNSSVWIPSRYMFSRRGFGKKRSSKSL